MEAKMGIWRDMFNDAKGALTFGDVLHAVSVGDNKFIANYLQQWPDRINKRDMISGKNILMHAIVKGPTDTVKLLLDKGASIRDRDPNGYNVLHMAVILGFHQKTALLLDRADIASILNDKNPVGGMTPLMYAAVFPENTDIVQRLLEKGADARMTDFSGKTALSMAREQGCAATVALLEQWSKGQGLPKRPKPAERTKPAERRPKPKRYKF